MKSYLVLRVEALTSICVDSPMKVKIRRFKLYRHSLTFSTVLLLKVGLLRGEVRTLKGWALAQLFSLGLLF